MGEAEADAGQLALSVEEMEEPKNSLETIASRRERINWWIRIFLCGFFVISGQAAAILLGRKYFEKVGNNSKWLATLLEPSGFPILIPFYFFSQLRNLAQPSGGINGNLSSTVVYVGHGLFLAGVCFLFLIGLMYLPVSTYSLICAIQLGFNALFSYFSNSQKFIPFIVNSLVFLTLSSTLLVDGGSLSSDGISGGKYLIGFFCTAGLIFEVSSLFSNAKSAVEIPMIPKLAVIFIGDKIDGVRVVALILALWGFVSYIYPHYLDDRKEPKMNEAQAQAQAQHE